MPSIGPAMLPNPPKRSRDDNDGRTPSPDGSEKRRRVAGPALPPSAASADADADADADAPARPARVMGPAAPPAPLDERPPSPPSDDSDSSSDDDDFGPAPPTPGASTHAHTDAHQDTTLAKSAFDTDPYFAEAPKKAQRDDWMTMPPTQDDLAARLDPTKQRARKFNSGKSAPSAGGMSSAWTETPEQKLKRLQDEAMGITSASSSSTTAPHSTKSRDEERRARKMREKIDAARGKSLVEQHQSKTKIEEDDPSKRVFDYEKDMAVQGNLNHKQKRDMLAKSKGFGDRFSSGSFL